MTVRMVMELKMLMVELMSVMEVRMVKKMATEMRTMLKSRNVLVSRRKKANISVERIVMAKIVMEPGHTGQ